MTNPVDDLRTQLAKAQELAEFWQDAAAGYLAEREQQTARWVETARERDAAEASRRDWAAEALKWREYTGTSDDKSYDWLVAFGLEHHDFPRVCACITDEQATQLGPGFSRPACAVHPPNRWDHLADCEHPGEYLRMGDHPDMAGRFVPEDLDPDTLYCLRCERKIDGAAAEGGA